MMRLQPTLRAPSSTEPSAGTEYALSYLTHTLPPSFRAAHHLVIFRSPRQSPKHSQLLTAAGNPMASILCTTLPASSRFSPLDQFQPTAAKRPLLVVKARLDDGLTTMDSAAKRPWWPPVLGIGWSGRAESKDPAPDRGDQVGRSNRSGLTTEKARVLRRKLRAIESWHDAMYHSAIASRLACPDHP